MNCPRCSLDLTDVPAAYCPRCGAPLPPRTPSYQDYPNTAAQGGYPTGPGGEHTVATQTSQPSVPLYGAPVSGAPYAPPTWQGSYPTAAPPSSPFTSPGSEAAWQGQSPYGPYAAGAPPSMPLYQPGATPYYGQNYGQSAPSSMPMYPPPIGAGWPGYVPTPPRPRSKTPIVVAVTLVLVLILAAAAGIALVGHGSPSVSGGTVTGAPTTTPGVRVVFSDPLTSNTNGWADDSYCHFGTGGYHVSNRVCYAPTGSFAATIVSVQASQVSGPINVFYGLVLRRASTGNYYAFQIDSNGKWHFFKVVNEKATDIQPYVPNGAIHHGLHTNNLLKVRAIGPHFDFYVNGVKVGQADDSTFASGRCGFEVYNSTEVVFSNFVIATPA